MKKFLALLLALVMTMSLVTVGASAKTAFTDDKDITEVEAVEVLSAMGIIDGYKDGSFKPQGTLNRAAGAKFIAYLMLGEKNADGLKATGTVFEDVAADYALAPYVEWCAKMGIVDGYGDGKFGPTNTLTQAAFGKMLLTALGYDSAKEGYTGAGWQKAVYADGLAAGVYGDDGEIFSACNRETAAKLALGALTATMVEYTRGDKLVDVTKNNQTVELWETYKDLKYAEGNDSWGRPGHTWEYGEDFDEFYADEAVATYTVATTYCDICDDLGESKEAKFGTTWTNGDKSNATVTIKSTNTSNEFGAQGQTIEIYDMGIVDNQQYYRMVIVDTYLAEVDSVTTEKLDKKGHVERDAYATLKVYTSADGTTTAYVPGTDLEEDQYVLVQVGAATTEIVGLNGGNKVATVKVVGEPETFESKLTKVHTDGKYELNDEWYDLAVKFFMGKGIADKTKVEYTWFLDQFGNVIGCEAIDTVYNYGVVTFLDRDTSGKVDKIIADITYVDGTEVTDVEIASIKVGTGDNAITMNVGSAAISTNSDANVDLFGNADNHADKKAVLADHLFRIEETKDGLVLTDTAWVTSAINAKNTKLENCTTILDDTTIFVVRTGDGDDEKPYEFEIVTGKDNIGKYAESTVHYVLKKDSTHAKYVYITVDPADAVSYQYVYVTGDSSYVKYNTDKGKIKYYNADTTVDMNGDEIEKLLVKEDKWTGMIKEALTTKGLLVKITTTGKYVTAVEPVISIAPPVNLDGEDVDGVEAVRAYADVDSAKVAEALDYSDGVLYIEGGPDRGYNVTNATILLDGKKVDASALKDAALKDEGVKAVYVIRNEKNDETHIAQTVILSTKLYQKVTATANGLAGADANAAKAAKVPTGNFVAAKDYVIKASDLAVDGKVLTATGLDVIAKGANTGDYKLSVNNMDVEVTLGYDNEATYTLTVPVGGAGSSRGTHTLNGNDWNGDKGSVSGLRTGDKVVVNYTAQPGYKILTNATKEYIIGTKDVTADAATTAKKPVTVKLSYVVVGTGYHLPGDYTEEITSDKEFEAEEFDNYVTPANKSVEWTAAKAEAGEPVEVVFVYVPSALSTDTSLTSITHGTGASNAVTLVAGQLTYVLSNNVDAPLTVTANDPNATVKIKCVFDSNKSNPGAVFSSNDNPWSAVHTCSTMNFSNCANKAFEITVTAPAGNSTIYTINANLLAN